MTASQAASILRSALNRTQPEAKGELNGCKEVWQRAELRPFTLLLWMVYDGLVTQQHAK